MLRDPIGRYLAGRTFVIWIHGPKLAGSAYFGRPDRDDYAALLSLFQLAQHACFAPPFDVLVDVSALEGLDVESFQHLSTYIGVAEQFAPRVRRVGIVRPDGLVGAFVAGVYHDVAVTKRFRLGLFSDRTEALGWLDNPASKAAGSELEEIMAKVRDTPEVLLEVRLRLAEDPATTGIAPLARALGTSTRSLQRRLGELGTSFRAEVDRARLRAAEALLASSNDKIETIARRLGYASASQFGARFRRVTGETPGEFRARRR
jgi:AraC-like DNA-binding protein